MAERRRTFAIDIEGKRIVCYSSDLPTHKEFEWLRRLGYRYLPVLEGEANYCFVGIPY